MLRLYLVISVIFLSDLLRRCDFHAVGLGMDISIPPQDLVKGVVLSRCVSDIFFA